MTRIYNSSKHKSIVSQPWLWPALLQPQSFPEVTVGSVVCRLGRPALSESNAHKKYSTDWNPCKFNKFKSLARAIVTSACLARQSFLTLLRLRIKFHIFCVPSHGLGLLYFGWQAWQTKLHLACGNWGHWAHCKFLPVTNQMILNVFKCQFCLLLFHTHLQRKCEPRKHSRRVMNCDELALKSQHCSAVSPLRRLVAPSLSPEQSHPWSGPNKCDGSTRIDWLHMAPHGSTWLHMLPDLTELRALYL